MRDALEVVKASGSNGRSRYTIKPLEEKLSFDKGFYVFIRAVQLLVNKNKGVVLVIIIPSQLLMLETDPS